MSLTEIKPGAVYVVTDCLFALILSLVLALIFAYVPVLGTFALLFGTLPLSLLVLRRGITVGCVTGMAVSVVSFFLWGSVVGLIFAYFIAVLGLFYGFAFKRGFSPAKTLFGGSVAAGVIVIAVLALASVTDVLPWNSLLADIEQSFQEVLGEYEDMGLLSQMLPQGMSEAEYIDTMTALFCRLLPGAFILSAMVIAGLNYILGNFVLRQLGFSLRTLPPFHEWHLPWWLLWGMVPVLLGYLMGEQLDGGYYFAIAQNILYIYLPVFLISGIALITYLFQTWHLGCATKVIIWVLCLFFITFALPFILLLGAADMLVDFRGSLRKAKKNKDNK